MLIFQSSSKDVYRNLAIEEYLMDSATDHGPVLFLWQSDCAVVMGKNQNPWRECRLDRMRKDGVPLARRISGGGTVYHDTGNLNYCVIVDRGQYRETQAFEMVVWALAPFGIRASRSGTSNLTVDGLKFSGNAFSFRKGRALHHGTLLLNADLERLERYLGSVVGPVETHAIPSVPAEVVNLGLERDAVVKALEESFESVYGDGRLERMTENGFDGSGLDLLVRRQKSVEWQYGATPRFALETGGRRVVVVKGLVESVDDSKSDGWVGQPFANIVISQGCQVD